MAKAVMAIGICTARSRPRAICRTGRLVATAALSPPRARMANRMAKIANAQ
ncbi:hypothetical protein D3C72_2313150 [compost metagenome]